MAPDSAVLDGELRRRFEQVLAAKDVLSDPVQCRAYECDGLTGYRVIPQLVLLPRDAAQVAAAVQVCAAGGVPFVARGAGTGLSGGALPVADGVVISLARLKRVLEVDPANRRAVLDRSYETWRSPRRRVARAIIRTDRPASRSAHRGNVAENAAVRTASVRFHHNHVRSVEVVLADGS